MYPFIHHLTSETCWYFLPFFSWFWIVVFFELVKSEQLLIPMNFLKHENRPLLGLEKKLGQSEYFDWNSESESYFLWTYSQGRQTPHQHCLQFTPRICRHLEEFRQVFKNSVHTFLASRGNIHVYWRNFETFPFLELWKGEGLTGS